PALTETVTLTETIAKTKETMDKAASDALYASVSSKIEEIFKSKDISDVVGNF
ncbi:hypothetical protein BGZ46_000227, partial [Entomortierella lignicola]